MIENVTLSDLEQDIEMLFEASNRNAILIEMLYEKLGIEMPEELEELIQPQDKEAPE
tara:strand:+ start:153 stop:323 length:171 start_codon:yes stop_codon:yes gene_type:complete